jgi:hypothetical protein
MEMGDGRWTNEVRADIEDLLPTMGSVWEGVNEAYGLVQIAGGFILGTPPTVNRNLLGNWTYNLFPSHQATRRAYSWSGVT